VVEQEEAGQAQIVDQLQLLVQPGAGLALVPVQPAVPIVERAAADGGELCDRRLLAVGEVGVAVAELLRQVECAAFGDARRALHGVPVEREPLEDLGGRAEDRLVVPPPFRLGALERRAMPDRDERVLEVRAARAVRVDVARDHRLDLERLGEVAEPGVPSDVSALERPLKLDEEAVASERPGEARRRVRVPDGEPVPRAARKTDETLVQLLQQRLVERWIERRLALLRPGVRVCGREEPAEVRVPPRALDEERDVRPVGERDLSPRDRPDTERLRCVSELQRAVDPVVIGERERLVAELRGAHRQLLGQ
jgi:hypothetical protein